ncbi:MAG: DUF952 domain-containing protein [Rhodothalassiaceae bacterium]
MHDTVYKIVPARDWQRAKRLSAWPGAAVDLADGFIHFSARHQVSETLAKHFHGQGVLMLLAFRSTDLAPALRWEASRGGDLFPHLYAPLVPALAFAEWPLVPRPDGGHVLPALP